MDPSELNHRLPRIVEALVQSVNSHPRLQHLNRVYLPSRDIITDIVKRLRELIYPGYFGKQGLTTENLPYRIGESVIELNDLLFGQVRCCLRYREQIPGNQDGGEQCEQCDEEAGQIVEKFFHRLPMIRELLATDVEAAFQGDPAAKSTDETIFCYPEIGRAHV